MAGSNGAALNPQNRPLYAPEEVAAEIRACLGNLRLVGERLGCTRRTVNRYVKKYPICSEAVADARGDLRERAEGMALAVVNSLGADPSKAKGVHGQMIKFIYEFSKDAAGDAGSVELFVEGLLDERVVQAIGWGGDSPLTDWLTNELKGMNEYMLDVLDRGLFLDPAQGGLLRRMTEDERMAVSGRIYRGWRAADIRRGLKRLSERVGVDLTAEQYAAIETAAGLLFEDWQSASPYGERIFEWQAPPRFKPAPATIDAATEAALADPAAFVGGYR